MCVFVCVCVCVYLFVIDCSAKLFRVVANKYMFITVDNI